MMVTMFDDEDIDRAAKALRQKFRFSDGSEPKMPKTCYLNEWNTIMANHSRAVSIRLSREAARLQFESMGAVYVPVPAKAA